MMPAVTQDLKTTQKTSEDSPPEATQNPPSRGIYLLPNLLTTGCLFSGFYSIVAAIDRNFALAGGAVFIAMVFDGLDGRVARWTRTESSFGKEYDSLADMVAFGVAPAVLVYQWGVVRIGEYGHEWRQFGCVAAFVWFFSKWREPGLPGLLLAFAVTGYAAALMVSGFSYLSLKQIDVNQRVKYSYIAFVILPMLILIRVDAPTMLFAMFVSYATYGPVQWLVRKLRRPRPPPSVPTS
jgi:CDP-diacylglycerol--serine O-phosphatidyltransferase